MSSLLKSRLREYSTFSSRNLQTEILYARFSVTGEPGKCENITYAQEHNTIFARGGQFSLPPGGISPPSIFILCEIYQLISSFGIWPLI